MPEVGQWFVALAPANWPGRVEVVDVMPVGTAKCIHHDLWPKRSTRAFGMSPGQFQTATTGVSAWWQLLPVELPPELRVSEGL